MKKLLVVEDDPSLRRILTEKLTKEGFEVISAQNGAEGLAAYRKQTPDLVLLDILMPMMDGMTMLEKLYDETKGKMVPVIMLTNMGGEEEIKIAARMGVTDYLIKSDWKLEDIVKKIKSKLGDN